MREYFLKVIFVVFFVLFFQCNIIANAVEEVVEETNNLPVENIEQVVDEKNAVQLESSQEKAIVGKITFDEISQKAKNHSYDIKLADFDLMISKQAIRGARSEYFPKVVATAGTEYTKNFNDYTNSVVTTVGDAFINPYTRFQSIFGVTLSYNLFDFGVRRDNLDIEKADTIVKELVLLEKFQDLDLTLVDTYSRLLMLKKQIDINSQILELTTDNYNMMQRLYDAEELSLVELQAQKAKVEFAQSKILELQSLAQEAINWLSFYTGETYVLDTLKVDEFDKPDFDPLEFNDYTKTITWQIQEKELKKKELALKIARKSYLPKVNAYSRYYIYGSDYSSYRDALKDISPSNYTVGASVIMPVFDGFKTSATVQKAMLELQQQQVFRDKVIAEFMNKLSIMRNNLMYVQQQTICSKNALKELKDKEKSIKKLVDKKISTPIELNETKIETLNQEIEYIKNSVTSVATLKAIQIITTY